MAKSIIFLLLLIICLIPSQTVRAADMLPPLDNPPEEVETAVENLLDTDNPCLDCDYFVITDVRRVGYTYTVSVAGLADVADIQAWSLLSDGEWLGVVTVNPDLTASGDWQDPPEVYLTSEGEYYYFPWLIGTTAVMGPRGVHGNGDYGLDGWYAIDWLSGPGFGSGAAPNAVYASQTAEISYVCRGTVNVAIRAGDFLYSHLVDNTYLEIGHQVIRGSPIGSLVTGTFSDNCGWADQQPNNYHVHWMFRPTSGHIGIENWVLDVASGTWTNSQNGATKTTGDSFTAGWAGETVAPGDPHVPPEGPIGPIGSGESIWDGLVGVVSSLVDSVLPIFPNPEGQQIGVTVISSAGAIIRVFYVLVSSHFRMGTTLLVFTVIFILEPIRIAKSIWMLIKNLIPGA